MIEDLINGIFNQNLQGNHIELLNKNLNTYNHDLSRLANAFMNVTKPLGMAFLGLILLLEMIKMTQKVQSNGGQITFSLFIPMIIKIAVCQIVMQHSMEILNAIIGIGNEIVQGFQRVVNNPNHNLDLSGKEALLDMVEDMSIPEKAMAFIPLLIAWVFAFIASRATVIVVTFIFIELYLFVSISPLAVATLPHEEFGGIAKNFFKNFCAKSLQLVLIFAVCAFYPFIYQPLLENDHSLLQFSFGFALAELALGILIWKTSSLAKSLTTAS